MQKLHLTQKTKQKISPQQLQAIALLPLTGQQLQERIAKELEENPMLEEEKREELSEDEVKKLYEEAMSDQFTNSQQKNNYAKAHKEIESKWIEKKSSWQEDLLHQLSCLSLTSNSQLIGKHIIGSLDEDGYMRKSLESIVNDMIVLYGIDTSTSQVEKILYTLQGFDPIGVAARSIQECLLLQLNKRKTTPTLILAKKIIKNHFPIFVKRHYDNIRKKLEEPSLDKFKEALALITSLNASPVHVDQGAPSSVIYPDFIVTLYEGEIQVALNKEKTPRLKVNKSYADLLGQKNSHEGERQETLQFVKNRILRAQRFIDAINQRKRTLLRTMRAIIDLQKAFFKEGDEKMLKPIFLRDVAEKIAMDVSTISRVVNKKKVQTPWGTFSLKYFFSEPINTTSGNKVSSRIVKEVLRELIASENKLHPYSDIILTQKLKEKGYLVARRTVTKYREQLKLPISRLRKNI